MKHKKIEFSKKLVTWAMVITTLSVILSYILAWLGRDSCQEMTISVVTTCITIAMGYQAKSFGEKNSRNKYGVTSDKYEGDSNSYNTDDNSGAAG